MDRLASLIFSNVFRNRRRSLLTLASTAVSLALLTLLLAIGQGFFYGTDATPSEALRLICRHRVSLTQLLPASHQARIGQIPGVAKTSAWTWFQGVYKDPKDFFARFGVDADTIFDIHNDWIVSPAELAAFKKSRTACAIAQDLATKYKLKLGDRITIVGDIFPVTLELVVSAIFQHPPQSEVLVFHREYLSELLPATSKNRDMASTYLIQAKLSSQVTGIAKAVDDMFNNSPYPTRTESEKEFTRSFMAFIGNIQLFLVAVCGAVTFTILLVSANTVAMAVRERTRETAILRTLGFTPTEILQLIVGESVFISMLGGAAGLLLGYLLAVAINKGGGGFGFPGVKWQVAGIVLAMAIVVGFVASLIPAFIASRKNVVESLRFSG